MKNIAVRSLDHQILEPMLRAVIAEADAGILVTDLEHQSLICNRRFGEIWGVDIESVVAASVDEVRADVLHRIVDLEGWRLNLESLYADPFSTQTDELVLKAPFAVVRRFSGPVLDGDGRPVGRLWTFLDVTRSHRRWRILEALHQSSLVTSADPRESYARIVDRVSEYFGTWVMLSVQDGDFMRFEAVGGKDNPAIGVEGNGLRDSYCQYCLAQNRTLVVQDGSLVPEYTELLPCRMGLTRYIGVPVRRSDGTAVGTLCILDGYSDDALHADDIGFLEQMAARIGGELERELHLAQLEQDLDTVQQSLIDGEKMIITGRLSASIAHDIRNILATIQVQLKMQDMTDGEKFAMIDEQIGRFQVLSHRLLSYSRPHAKHGIQIDLHEVLLTVADLLSPHAKIASIPIEVNLTATDAWILGDSVQLEHLFLNLLLNAVQAMPSGGKIWFETRNLDENRFEVVVRDNGPGIPEGVRGNLFEPFQSDRSDGIGLGLYSCKQIAESHEAVLECVHSGADGTSFRLEFARC